MSSASVVLKVMNHAIFWGLSREEGGGHRMFNGKSMAEEQIINDIELVAWNWILTNHASDKG
ncbi:hypothetical protein FRX31_017157 [Thalictrum thalictroides]|uniref:Uncharacterized protein n=1 Tax=Thalictrum thalictroides TaxID=46969 RepID=A0A7J6WA47_THATH|nr:hypothetical protein FRX31_017157 [Thalictrum thalictroides]